MGCLAREPSGVASRTMRTRGLWVVIVCLALLSACSGTTNSGPAAHETAFVYTYFAQNGEAGVAGANPADGTDVWRTPIGHANWAPIIVGTCLYACVRVHGQATQTIVAVRIADGQVLWRTELPESTYNAVINADATTVVVNGGDRGLYALLTFV